MVGMLIAAGFGEDADVAGGFGGDPVYDAEW